jgi:hypothetical protein
MASLDLPSALYEGLCDSREPDRPVFVQRYRWTACCVIGWLAELVAVVGRKSTLRFLLTLHEK